MDLASTTLWDLAITLGLGLLVGLERERAGKEVGLRTFSFTALLGYLSWNFGPMFALAVLGFVALIVVVINIRALQKGADVEATTSVSLFLIVFVGMLVAEGNLFVAVAAVIFMLLLLSWKEEMVLFSRALKRHEIHAAITLGLLTFVILPVLPDTAVDPWGLFVPQRLWLIVVLISAIGFANYVLLRLYGARGIAYTGFFAGLINSQVTALTLARQVRGGDGRLEDLAFRGIMWAKTAAFLRNGLILSVFAPRTVPAVLLPVGLTLCVTLFLALYRARYTETPPPAVAVESPFSLGSALQFGALFTVITVLGTVAQHVAGPLGFYAVSFAGGLVSSASATAMVATLVNSEHITPLVGGAAVVLSSVASAFVILPLVWRGSSRARLVHRVSVALLWVLVAIAIGIAVNPYFLHHFAALEQWLEQR